MNGEITKEAVSLMRRAAEITGNEEIKFAAAHIQSEYDKKHPRQLQGQVKRIPVPPPAEKSKFQYTLKKQLPRSVSAPNVSYVEKKKTTTGPAPNRIGQIQSQLPRKRWTTRSNLSPRENLKPVPSTSDISITLQVTKGEAAQLQSIADRTKNPELKELSKKLQHIALVGGTLGPIHNVRITAEEAARLESLAAKSGNKELEDVARYSQSVAATSGVGIDLGQAGFLPSITKEDASHLQRAADLTGDQELKDYARYAQSVSETTGQSALPGPGVDLTHVTKTEASHLQAIADRTGNAELKEFSKEVQSVVDSLSAGAGTS